MSKIPVRTTRRSIENRAARQPLHDTHDLAMLSDGDMGCRACHRCNCHYPDAMSKPCPGGDQ